MATPVIHHIPTLLANGIRRGINALLRSSKLILQKCEETIFCTNLVWFCTRVNTYNNVLFSRSRVRGWASWISIPVRGTSPEATYVETHLKSSASFVLSSTNRLTFASRIERCNVKLSWISRAQNWITGVDYFTSQSISRVVGEAVRRLRTIQYSYRRSRCSLIFSLKLSLATGQVADYDVTLKWCRSIPRRGSFSFFDAKSFRQTWRPTEKTLMTLVAKRVAWYNRARVMRKNPFMMRIKERREWNDRLSLSTKEDYPKAGGILFLSQVRW